MNFVDGDFFENLCDVKYLKEDFNNDNINRKINEFYLLNKRIIYVYTPSHNLFKLLNSLNTKINIVIVAHNSDFTLEKTPIIPSNVKKIFLQNYNGLDYDIIEPLPIGLERIRWSNSLKHNLINDIRKINKENNIDVYMNFSLNTHPSRKEWFNYFKNKNYITHKKNLSLKNYFNDIHNSKFILSPRGNGIDCHRTYECLYLNSIPVIKKSNFSTFIFKNSNVFLIDNFENVSLNELNIYAKSNNKTNDILDKNYWIKKIYLK